MKLEVDVIFFDAAGTLFKVKGSVGEIYSRMAARYRVFADPKQVDAAFRKAFHAKSLESFPSGGSAGLRAEKAWWMDVVRQVFGETMKPEDLRDYFDEVFEAFRGSAAWALYEDTRPSLERLRAGGYRLAVISNFDSRLFDVLANLEIDCFFERVILSWHAGAAKPDPAIFRSALETMHAPASRAAHVGDSLHDDVAGANASGLAAPLLDRKRSHLDWDAGPRLESLIELPQILA
jgi:putative hydrolase of the HAD superfamily